MYLSNRRSKVEHIADATDGVMASAIVYEEKAETELARREASMDRMVFANADEIGEFLIFNYLVCAIIQTDVVFCLLQACFQPGWEIAAERRRRQSGPRRRRSVTLLIEGMMTMGMGMRRSLGAV